MISQSSSLSDSCHISLYFQTMMSHTFQTFLSVVPAGRNFQCVARAQSEGACNNNHANVIENIHFKSLLAFYLAHGDVFRAQGQLLTPPELRDRCLQRFQVHPISQESSGSPLYHTKGFHCSNSTVEFDGVYLGAQMELEGVLRF